MEIISHHISFWESNLEIESLQSRAGADCGGREGDIENRGDSVNIGAVSNCPGSNNTANKDVFVWTQMGDEEKSKDWRLKVSFIKTSQCLFYLKDLKNVFCALGHIFSWKVHCSSSMPQPVFVVLSESSSKLTIRCNLRLYLFGTMLIIILYCTIHIVLSLWSIANTEYTHSKDL